MAHLIIRRVFSIFYLIICVYITIHGQSSLDDLNVVFKHDFENNTLGDYLYNEWESDWLDPAGNDRQSAVDIAQNANDQINPSKALQFNFPANSVGADEGGATWFTPINKTDEIYVSYDLMFMPGFEYQYGGKLPSVQGGSVTAGVKPNGYDGFTGGLLFRQNGMINFYIYYPDSRTTKYGETFLWGTAGYPAGYFLPSSVIIEYGSGTVPLCRPGEWHNITYRMVLNTVKPNGGGNFDGILEAYFDGKLVLQLSHLLFRHTTALGIDYMRMYTFFGGDDDASRNPIEEWLRVDNVILYTFKDGIDVPRGNVLSPKNRTINYWRNFESDNTGAQAPASPLSLSQTNVTSSSLSLKWSDNSNTEQGFAIYRSTSATKGFVQIGTVPANITGYTDNSVDPATPYYYRVLAFNSIAYSSFSNTLSVTTPGNSAFPYKICAVKAPCNSSDFFDVPLIKTTVDTLEDCIGFDLVMTYDKNKVIPTGKIQINNDLVDNISLTDYDVGIYDTLIAISLYLNAGDPARARFNGTGQVLAVEFRKTMNFKTGDTARFTVPSLMESYVISTKSSLVEPGIFSTYCDSTFNGTLRFWSGYSPIGYNNKDSTIITNIFVTDTTGKRISDTALQPDISGNFECKAGNGTAIQIDRDIPGGADMMPVINGIDVHMIRKVLVQDNSFIPNIYQIIAMDVNMDGKISAGDITQMNQRTMSQTDEYQQAWNYDNQGVSNGAPSKDWLFIPGRTLSSVENFRISATYPADDHKGYSKFRVPVIPNSLPLPVEDLFNSQQVNNEIYQGVLLGDVDGNSKRVSANSTLKSASQQTADQVVFDMSSAQVNAGIIDIPVSIQSDTPVYSLDFALRFDEEKIRFQSVVRPAEYLQYQAFYNKKDKTLRLTSNSLQQFNTAKPIFSLRFAIITGQPGSSDILSANVYLNGEPETFKVKDNIAATTGENEVADDMKIYPNPASSFLFIEAPAKATVQVLDITGSNVYVKSMVADENKYKLDVQDLRDGMYLIKIQYGKLTLVRKLIISH